MAIASAHSTGNRLAAYGQTASTGSMTSEETLQETR